jgi:hypothetical protein
MSAFDDAPVLKNGDTITIADDAEFIARKGAPAYRVEPVAVMRLAADCDVVMKSKTKRARAGDYIVCDMSGGPGRYFLQVFRPDTIDKRLIPSDRHRAA